VENKTPALVHRDPHEGGRYNGIRPALLVAAREAYMQNKSDPQLLIVIEPVSRVTDELPTDSVLAER
jgi:hypothetical protein